MAAVFDRIEQVYEVEKGDEHYTIIEEFPEINYALIYRHTQFEPWVAAYGFNADQEYWQQGHYFRNGYDAMKFIVNKYKGGYEND